MKKRQRGHHIYRLAVLKKPIPTNNNAHSLQYADNSFVRDKSKQKSLVCAWANENQGEKHTPNPLPLQTITAKG